MLREAEERVAISGRSGAGEEIELEVVTHAPLTILITVHLKGLVNIFPA